MMPTTANNTEPFVEPSLADRTVAPKGVFKKNLKMMVYMGVVLMLILAMFVSSTNDKKKGAAGEKGKDATVAPVVQDNTANNVAALHAQLATEKQRQEQEEILAAATVPTGTSAQQAATASLTNTGQPAAPGPAYAPATSAQGGGQAQLSPEQQQVQQLAGKERERQYASRFESNLAYSRTAQLEQAQVQGLSTPPLPSNLTAPRLAGETPPQPAAPATYKRSTEVDINAASGQPYVIYEGMTLDTVLMNRLDGDAAGPVKVLVSNPVYSHDHQHVLIPEGTIVLGEARKIGGTGIGQQRRMAVIFHRMIMPDGFSTDLDQFHGLDQIGEEGLKDKVNNHYLQIFGTSIALGVISGAAQITQGGSGYNASGSQSFVNGASAGISQQATTILDRFIQIPPTITIREGHRVKVYFTQDMLLPAYTNHTIPQTF